MSTASQVFRKGKRILKVPLNGQQKFELKNNDHKSRYIEVSFHSSRLSILESRRETFDKFEFSVYLKSKHSLIFTVVDRGRWEETEDFSVSYEGLLRIMVKTGKCVEGQPPNGSSLHLPDMVVTLDPETDSYRTFCEIKDDNAEMILEHVSSKHPLNKIITIEPFEYEKSISENVTILKLTEKDELDNKRMEKEIAEKVKITMAKRKNDSEVKPPKLEPVKGRNTYRLGQGWRTLGNEESEKTTKSVQEANPTSNYTKSQSTESQNIYKLMEQNSKPIDPAVLEKLEGVLDGLAENEQENQEMKDENLEKKEKKKKKKKCVIS